VEERPLADLSVWERNPRRISGERLQALKRSLEHDREMLGARPLVALPDGRVVCGNQRLLAARELGWETIPTVVVDLDEQRAAVWALRDNNSYGEWDDTLADFLAELAGDDVDLDLAGFRPAELEALLCEAAGALSPADPDAAPPLPSTPPRSTPGAIYELGPHRLACGDSGDLHVMSALCGDRPAEVMWTDPPYGVEYEGKTARRLRLRNDHAHRLEPLLAGVFAAADGVLAPCARVYVCAPAGLLGVTFAAAFTAAGWRLHQQLVWVKNAIVLGRSDYHYQHEQILYGHTAGPGRPGRGRHQGSRWYGDNRQASVFFVDKPAASRVHPTMKPVELVEAQLRNSSRRGDTVLDPFAGSGSTLIACERLGRTCLTVELDPGYCDVIRARYAEYTGRPDLAP